MYRADQQRVRFVIHLTKTQARVEREQAEARAALALSAVSRTSSHPRGPAMRWKHKLSHHVALAIVPDDDTAAEIQDIRRIYDPTHVDKWPAHVTLFYPFAEADDLARAVAVLRDQLAHVDAFDLTLDDVSSFNQGKRGHVLYLDPAPASDVTALKQRVRRLLKGPLTAKGQPHLTVGRRCAVTPPFLHACMYELMCLLFEIG